MTLENGEIEIVWGSVLVRVIFVHTHLNGFTGRFEYDSTLATALMYFNQFKKIMVKI